jgi:hypothetical protein
MSPAALEEYEKPIWIGTASTSGADPTVSFVRGPHVAVRDRRGTAVHPTSTTIATTAIPMRVNQSRASDSLAARRRTQRRHSSESRK